MAKKQTAVTYDLLDCYGRVVYRGSTTDPQRREGQHRRAGKQFKTMRITSGPMARGSAREREQAAIAAHRESHDGNLPKYNKTRAG
jgi:predicted GIY-YIG superfamily endonuclease